jgi:hypothetical protein
VWGVVCWSLVLVARADRRVETLPGKFPAALVRRLVLSVGTKIGCDYFFIDVFLIGTNGNKVMNLRYAFTIRDVVIHGQVVDDFEIRIGPPSFSMALR